MYADGGTGGGSNVVMLNNGVFDSKLIKRLLKLKINGVQDIGITSITQISIKDFRSERDAIN
jgi:hypothetical protein